MTARRWRMQPREIPEPDVPRNRSRTHRVRSPSDRNGTTYPHRQGANPARHRPHRRKVRPGRCCARDWLHRPRPAAYRRWRESSRGWGRKSRMRQPRPGLQAVSCSSIRMADAGTHPASSRTGRALPARQRPAPSRARQRCGCRPVHSVRHIPRRSALPRIQLRTCRYPAPATPRHCAADRRRTPPAFPIGACRNTSKQRRTLPDNAPSATPSDS